MSAQRTITLLEEDEGWTAIDEDTGLECRGEERERVLERLDDAVEISFDGNESDADAGTEEATAPDDALEWFES